MLSTLGTTALGEIPLNQQMFTWNPATPVPGWETARASWLHFHWIKTGLSFAAFIVAAMGLAHEHGRLIAQSGTLKPRLPRNVALSWYGIDCAAGVRG